MEERALPDGRTLVGLQVKDILKTLQALGKEFTLVRAVVDGKELPPQLHASPEDVAALFGAEKIILTVPADKDIVSIHISRDQLDLTTKKPEKYKKLLTQAQLLQVK